MLDCDKADDLTLALRLALFMGIQDVRRDIKKRTGKELMERLGGRYRNYHQTALHTVYTAGRTNEEIAARDRASTTPKKTDPQKPGSQGDTPAA